MRLIAALSLVNAGGCVLWALQGEVLPLAIMGVLGWGAAFCWRTMLDREGIT